MTSGEGKTVRMLAAELVREWADRRMVSVDTMDVKHGAKERFALAPGERTLFEECADDIERGRK